MQRLPATSPISLDDTIACTASWFKQSPLILDRSSGTRWKGVLPIPSRYILNQ
jgi:hypothetical protein